MGFTKQKREWLFWTLQFVGWFGFNAVVFVVDLGLSDTFLFFNLIMAGLSGVIPTSLYRIYLKNNIDFEVFDITSIKRFLVAFVACCFMYYWLGSLFDSFYDAFWTKTEAEKKFITDNTGLVSIIFSITFNLFVWTILYFVIKFILNSNANRAKSLQLNSILKEAQLNSLKGQVNPHFMFNSLNNIRGLMLEDVEKSREMLTKLSEMLVFSLENNKVDAIPLRQEMEMVRNYIALSKIQMEDRLVYQEDIDKSLLNEHIPPMIIQLLVENAAKHGIANLKKGGVIEVRAKSYKGSVTITVTNTGTLQIKSDSTQLGLKNIKQRLRLQYGKKANFSIANEADNVVAKIKIPLNSN